MDPRLLHLYRDELVHVREMGAEFARQFPKVAGRLGMETMEVADPYVERLLEGFAFLAARVQHKLEAEHPRLLAHLLESTYPNFLAPVPSMMVARLDVDVLDPNLSKGAMVPRGSVLRATVARGQDTHVEFRTAHALELWPIEIVSVRAFTQAGDIPLARLPASRGFQCGLRVRLRCGGGARFDRLAAGGAAAARPSAGAGRNGRERQARREHGGLNALGFYIAAPDEVAARLVELVLGRCMGTWVTGAGASVAPQAMWSDAESSVRQLGAGLDEALLPESLRAFSGHRLMQEFAAMPQRLQFFEFGDLRRRLAHVAATECDLVLFFDRHFAGLEAQVNDASLALNCTPAINLFPKRLDRIQLAGSAWEHHVVPDRTRPMDFEVHSLTHVTGYGTGTVVQQRFTPLYGTTFDADDDAHASGGSDGHYTLRREPRRLSIDQKQQGTRSSYVGDEVFVSIVEARRAAHGAKADGELRQLSLEALVSNRDLPTLLPAQTDGGPALWRWDGTGPVRGVHVLRGPTRPVSRAITGDLGWRLVRHLGLNHLSLIDQSPQQAAAAIRDGLRLYGPPEDVAWTRLVDGLQGVTVRQAVRRMPMRGPITYGSGVDIDLELDELAAQGTGAFLFATALEHWFGRHAAINAFTRVKLRSPQRGELHTWAPRVGCAELV
jgi:type VI secretion system protein ImpG